VTAPTAMPDVSRRWPAVSLEAREDRSAALPLGQGFHTQENNFLVRRLEGIARSREQDGAG
jgi:hypothetical protein